MLAFLRLFVRDLVWQILDLLTLLRAGRFVAANEFAPALVAYCPS